MVLQIDPDLVLKTGSIDLLVLNSQCKVANKGYAHLQLSQKIVYFPVCVSSVVNYLKQCGPRSDCSCRSSLIWVHNVCLPTYVKYTFSDAVILLAF